MINNKVTLALCLLSITNMLASPALAQNCTMTDIAGTWAFSTGLGGLDGIGILNADGTIQGEPLIRWQVNGNIYTMVDADCKLVDTTATVNSACTSLVGVTYDWFIGGEPGDVCMLEESFPFVGNKISSPPGDPQVVPVPSGTPPKPAFNIAPITSLLLSDSPNGKCASGGVFDCKLNCMDVDVKDAWVGDGSCDNGSFPSLDLISNQLVPIYLNCSTFNNDGGDCG